MKRSIIPQTASEKQEISVIYEITNTGSADVSSVTIKENSSIAKDSASIGTIKAGETAKHIFTVKMGKKDLTSAATISYKAGGKSYTKKVDSATIKYGKVNLSASLSADKKGGAPGDPIKLTLKLSNSGSTDFTNIVVTDEKLGTVFEVPSLEKGKSLTLEKDLVITETTDLQFVVTADGAEGATLKTASGRVHVVATDPAKQVVLRVEAKADREEVYTIPGKVRFTITVFNESAVEVKNITVKAVDREVYFFETIPSGESRSVTRDTEISMAGTFQFTASTKDELGQIVTFASNTLPIVYAPPTPEPTEAPLVTPPAPATVAIPQETPAPDWIAKTESTADTAKWVFTGIAAVLGTLLLIGAIRRGRSKAQSNKAMDHLEGANYRDYSVAPKRRRRNEVISGEEEQKEEAVAETEAEELPQEAAETNEQGSDLMAETLKRLYDEPTGAAEAASNAAEGVAAGVEKAAEAAKDAAETVKAETEQAVQNVQEATRRRRNGKA